MMKAGVSVFGAAPSIATMRAMNKRGQKMFTAGEFWYYFRVYLPFFGPIVFLVFMLSAILGWNTVQGHLILGSVVSLLATTSVVASYIMIVPWRKHPSVLILYRSLTSLVFSVNLLLDASTDNSAADSRGFAFVTEFMLILGECWLTTIAIDLVHSLTNPFISYRYNLQRFQVYNITFSFFLSLIFFFNRSCQDTYEHITWVKVDQSERSPCLWGYYFVWILMMYSYQLWATVFAYNRLRKGLSSSFDIRKQCANDTFKCLSVYAVYIVVLLISFITISLVPADERSDSPISTFTAVTLFFVANRGSVDAVAWFLLHDFIRSDAPLNQSIAQDDPDTPVKSPPAPKRRMTLSEVRQMEELEAGTRSEAEDQEGQPTRSRSLTLVVQSMNEITNATTDMDEADLSPQVNIALRQQVVQYVTMGVQEAINKPTPPPIKRTFLQEMQEFIYPITDFAAIEGMEVTEYILDATHPFKAFSPKVFKGLRMQEGIDDDKYLKTLQSTANERLSEGASGAFMFFCGGGEFIVKTIRDREARVLHASLKKYAKYLRRNRNSLLCRFLGSYSLAMYEQTFYFVVMLNCFDPKAKINERFDIKGSWINRSADPVKPNKKVVCRHCNEYFIPAAKEQCTIIVGRHEANVVLKDNDLRNRISLRHDEAKQVVNILKKDSDLLGELGVLDYSLLVGIKKGKFEIINGSLAKLADHDSRGAELDVERLGEGENGDRTSALKPNGSERQSEFLASHVIGPSIYHFGIVDFLQDWTFEKEMERNFKITVGRNDPEGISVMEPIPYKLRFQSKMDQIFALDDDPVVSGIPPLPGMLSPSTRSAVGLENILHAQVKRGREGSIVNPLLLESAGVALDNDSPPRSLQQQHSSSQLEHSQEEDTRPVQGTNEPDPWKEDQDATF